MPNAHDLARQISGFREFGPGQSCEDRPLCRLYPGRVGLCGDSSPIRPGPQDNFVNMGIFPLNLTLVSLAFNLIEFPTAVLAGASVYRED